MTSLHIPADPALPRFLNLSDTRRKCGLSIAIAPPLSLGDSLTHLLTYHTACTLVYASRAQFGLDLLTSLPVQLKATVGIYNVAIHVNVLKAGVND